jgi:hypothetical protein
MVLVALRRVVLAYFEKIFAGNLTKIQAPGEAKEAGKLERFSQSACG